MIWRTLHSTQQPVRLPAEFRVRTATQYIVMWTTECWVLKIPVTESISAQGMREKNLQLSDVSLLRSTFFNIFAIRMDNYHNQYTLGEVLQQLIDKFRLRNRMNSETLQAAWPEIAGALVARHTKSVQLDGPVLYIEVDEPALRNELLYMQSDIISAVNKRLHDDVVEKLVIR